MHSSFALFLYVPIVHTETLQTSSIQQNVGIHFMSKKKKKNPRLTCWDELTCKPRTSLT